MKYLLILLVAATLHAAPEPERLIIYSGALGFDPDPAPLKAYLDKGWTVKHIVPYGRDTSKLAVVISPPTEEWIAYLLAKEEAARQEARKAREDKDRQTKL